MLHRLRFAQNDAIYRSIAASVHRRHELCRPAAAFPSYFAVKLVQMYAVLWPKVRLNKCRCLSFHRVGCLSRSVSSSRSIAFALLEDKETRHRSHSLQTVTFESKAFHCSMRQCALHSNIDEYQVNYSRVRQWTSLHSINGRVMWRLTRLAWSCEINLPLWLILAPVCLWNSSNFSVFRIP